MNPLCLRGTQLQEQAAVADQMFKSRLLEYFSASKKEADETRQIEILGVRQREADEVFRRHQELCAVCSAALLPPAGRHQGVVASREMKQKTG